MPNFGSINSHAVNDQAGVRIVASGSLVDIVQIVNTTRSGSLVSVAQNVGIIASGSLVSLAQTTQLRITGSGALVNAVQLVKNTASGSLVNIEQVVIAEANFFDRNGFEPRLYIGSDRIADNQIHDNIRIIYTENAAPQLVFTLIPPTGVQDIRSYRGKTAKCVVRTANGTFSVFQGKVNLPQLRVIDQKIVFNCSIDIEQEVESQVSRSALNGIGLWSEDVFSKPQTRLQELEDRITTLTSSLDWDRNGKYRVNSILAKSTADYELNNSDVFRRELQYSLASGQRVINKIEIKATYDFPRLHHHQRTASWTADQSVLTGLSNKGYIDKETVRGAIEGLGWATSSPSFTEYFPSGWYNVEGVLTAFNRWVCRTETRAIAGSTTNGDTDNEAVKVCSDLYAEACLGASWTMQKRFAQTLTEEYTMTVSAPQSITEYGEKKREDTFSLSSNYNTEQWESYENYNGSTPSAPRGAVLGGNSGNNYWFDANDNNKAFANNVSVLLNKAKSEIIKSHREDSANFMVPIWPEIQLEHTVFVNTDRVQAKGKVRSYTHTINIGTGEGTTEVELALSKSTGSASDSSLTIPARPTITPSYDGGVSRFTTVYGKDATAQFDAGFVGAVIGTFANPAAPAIRLTTPEIKENLRGRVLGTRSASYTVAIPDDTLQISFTDEG